LLLFDTSRVTLVDSARLLLDASSAAKAGAAKAKKPMRRVMAASFISLPRVAQFQDLLAAID
jgi:hypothetical protein